MDVRDFEHVTAGGEPFRPRFGDTLFGTMLAMGFVRFIFLCACAIGASRVARCQESAG